MNERYSRQLVLKGFGAEGQEKLSKSRILVVGAGGLGCPALLYLTGAGIKHIGIVDGDQISLSNLHRQVLYMTADTGRLKVEIALKRLAEANPEICFEVFPFFLQRDNCIEILDRYDVVLDCSDNFEVRYLLSDACAMLNKPLIFGAVSGWEGQLAVFHKDSNGLRTNYRDLFPTQPGYEEIPNCEQNGVIGVLPGIIGTMQAAEAIKLVTGVGKSLLNQLLNYNLLDQSIYTIDILPAPAGSYKLPADMSELRNTQYQQNSSETDENIIEISVEEMHELIDTVPTLVIDVREFHEQPSLSTKHIQLPMSVFDISLPTEISEPNIVLVCQHGIRSLAAAKKLRSRYNDQKNIYSLAGGIARWYGQL